VRIPASTDVELLARLAEKRRSHRGLTFEFSNTVSYLPRREAMSQRHLSETSRKVTRMRTPTHSISVPTRGRKHFLLVDEKKATAAKPRFQRSANLQPSRMVSHANWTRCATSRRTGSPSRALQSASTDSSRHCRHEAGDGDAEAGVVGHGRLEESDRTLLLFVEHDLCERDARGIIDGDMDILPAHATAVGLAVLSPVMRWPTRSKRPSCLISI
jgi:hypothetical protein